MDKTAHLRMRRHRQRAKDIGLRRLDCMVPDDIAMDFRTAADAATRLTLMVKQATRDFRASCFWNMDVSSQAPIEFSETAIRRLRRHGGMKGWWLAREIAKERQRYADAVSKLDPSSHREEAVAR